MYVCLIVSFSRPCRFNVLLIVGRQNPLKPTGTSPSFGHNDHCFGHRLLEVLCWKHIEHRWHELALHDCWQPALYNWSWEDMLRKLSAPSSRRNKNVRISYRLQRKPWGFHRDSSMLPGRPLKGIHEQSPVDRESPTEPWRILLGTLRNPCAPLGNLAESSRNPQHF